LPTVDFNEAEVVALFVIHLSAKLVLRKIACFHDEEDEE